MCQIKISPRLSQIRPLPMKKGPLPNKAMHDSYSTPRLGKKARGMGGQKHSEGGESGGPQPSGL